MNETGGGSVEGACACPPKRNTDVATPDWGVEARTLSGCDGSLSMGWDHLLVTRWGVATNNAVAPMEQTTSSVNRA